MAGIGLCDGEVVLSASGLFHCSCFTWVLAMACVVVGVVWVCVCFVFVCFCASPVHHLLLHTQAMKTQVIVEWALDSLLGLSTSGVACFTPS